MIAVAVMAVGFIGMIVCSKKQKTNPAMQPVAILLCIVVLGAAGYLLWGRIGGGGAATIMKSDYAFLASRGYAAGTHLKQVAPGKKLIVITEPNALKSADPNSTEPTPTQNLIDMLKKGYGSEDVAIEALMIPGASDENAEPIEERMRAKDFDAVLNKYKDAAVVVSLVGLPKDVARMAAFRAKQPPVFFLLSTGMETGKFIVNQINKGNIAGVIVPNPKADYEAKAPADPAKAFAIRFVLVTKSNLDANKQFFE